jgi:DNA-binding MarR family transcriptional regulator
MQQKIDMQKTVKTIQSFTHFYSGMALQWEKNLLCRGYDLYEIRTLLELYLLGACTPRELASRLDTRVEKMSCVVNVLRDKGLVLLQADSKERLFDKVCLTDFGNEEAKRFQVFYDASIASALGRIEEEERIELVQHLKRVKEIFADVESGKRQRSTTVDSQS